MITLDIPRPWGAMSNQRWNEDVLLFHIAIMVAATTVSAQEVNVKPYNLPVLRITLTRMSKIRRWHNFEVEKTSHHPAKTLPVEIATYHKLQLGEFRNLQ